MAGKASMFASMLFSAVFLLSGAAMLLVAMNDDWVGEIDSGATCASGADCGGSVRSTLLIVGGSFTATGLFSGALTYYIARRARRWVTHLATAQPLDSTENITAFLKPFGIDLSRANLSSATVTEPTVNLRPEIRVEPGGERLTPEEAARVSDALRPLGINLDPGALRSAGDAAVSTSRSSAASDEAPPSALRRERATILRKHDRGATAGQQRLVEFELEVTPATSPPYRAVVASLVRESLVGLLVEGGMLTVRVDPYDRENVSIDWSEN